MRSRLPIHPLLAILCLSSFLLCLWFGQVATAQTPTTVQLVQQGVDLYQAGDYKTAADRWKTVLDAHPNDPATAVIIQENLARVYQQLGRSDAAIALWEQVTAYYRQTKNPEPLGHSLTEQAQVYSSLGQSRKAIALLCGQEVHRLTAIDQLACLPESALQLARAANDKKGEAAVLGSLGDAQRLLGDYRSAIVLLQASLKLALDTPAYRIAAFNSLGNTYSSLVQVNYRRIDIAANSLSLEDQGKIVASSTSANGGNILINVKDLLLLRRNGLISAEAETREASALINSIAGTPQATGDGGNVTINSPFIIAVPEENSDVTANAFTGRGGRVNIVTQGIFGLQFRPQRTARSDITASSTFGISGVVVITSPDNSFLQNSLTQLAQNLIDPNTLLANSCIVRSRDRSSNGTFLVTGSGGLPVRPGDALPASFPTGEVRSLPQKQTNQPWQPGDPITEPQGIYRLANGKLVMGRECEP